MRISDWSSDVCSSDLRNESEVAGDSGMVERRHGIAATRDRGQRAFARQRGGSLGKRDGRGVEGRRLERAERAVPHQSAAIFEHVGERFDRGGRSEEHTSELQSLMRISYAVFCLKKKIKIRKKTEDKERMTHIE